MSGCNQARAWQELEDDKSQEQQQQQAQVVADSWVNQLFAILPSWPEQPLSHTDGAFPTPHDVETPQKDVARTRSSMATTVASFDSTENDAPRQSIEVSWMPRRKKKLQRFLSNIRSRMTMHSKRCVIATSLLVFVIVLLSVLVGTLTSRSSPSTPNSAVAGPTTNDPPVYHPTDVPFDYPPPPANPQEGVLDMTVMDFSKAMTAFSTLHPVEDLGMFGVTHSRLPPDSVQRSDESLAVPTNAWYQNLIMADSSPTEIHKAYTIPYVVDAVGPIPGLRVQPTHLTTTSTVVQLIAADGVTLGVDGGDASMPKGYSVQSTNPLGLTLTWNALSMSSTIIRGMPYATMHYPKPLDATMLPTVASEVKLQEAPLLDGVTKLDCASSAEIRVESEVKFTLINDFTWMLFLSESALMRCVEREDGTTLLQVTQVEGGLERFTMRAALLTNCTNGFNAIHCADETKPTEAYEAVLRKHADMYPGPNADVSYAVDHDQRKGVLRLDWDVQDMKGGSSADADLIMYALPHHLGRMEQNMPWDEPFCTTSLIGSTCIASGSTWDLVEDLPILDFRAPRPPRPGALPVLSQALRTDIEYRIPDNFMRGAGDTYFSGKMLARAARVLLITEEVEKLCDANVEAYAEACSDITLPTEEQISDALDRLRNAVEVWINGTSEATFAYDSGWGGVISCGCNWNDGTQSCDNALPECPALSNQGLNFGNAFYNDHHFHYGYHIYAAAALAHFDKEWGRDHFEEVLLLVRDFANPSSNDAYFPKFRNKDWYHGSSWASGITMPEFANGMNQESSSEAIAAYEAVALFGKEMATAWEEVNDSSKVAIANSIRDTGSIMAATEIRSTDYYWHVRRKNDSRKIFPAGYEHSVVGILWNSMAQFTTWFGNDPFLIYGIQLLPLTPISENRDDVEWVKEMYEPLSQSCVSSEGCAAHGWSVLQLAMLASIGHVETAMEQAQLVPSSAFNSAGGNGHSMSNTLWYFSTRPQVDPVDDIVVTIDAAPEAPQDVFDLIDCGIPARCTRAVLDSVAEGYACRDRIAWLMDAKGLQQGDACRRVADEEFPDICGPCGSN